MASLRSFLFENKTEKQTIAKNTAWLFFGEMLGRLLKFGLILYATRALGATGFGIFSYALAFVAIMYTFSDIGINTFVTRELSKGSEGAQKYLYPSFVLKIILLALSLVASIFIIPRFGTVTLGLKLVIALTVLNFSDSLREYLFSINRSLQKMEVEAIIKVVMSVLITGLGIMLLFLKTSPLSLSEAYAVGSLVATGLTLAALVKPFRHVRKNVSADTAKEILIFAWPFLAITIFSTMIANIDTVMLGQMKSVTEVGIYSAAERIVQFLSVLPIFVGTATFPIMAKNEFDAPELGRILEKTLVAVLMVGFPIAIGGALLGTPIMRIFFGPQFAIGGAVLAILMVSLLAAFANLILSNAIFAKNLQRKFVTATILGTILNIAINLCMIPLFGAIGAAISATATQFLITTINWLMLKRSLPFSIVTRLAKIAVATVGMVVLELFLSKLGISAVVNVVISGAGYVTILSVLREPLLKELVSLATR